MWAAVAAFLRLRVPGKGPALPPSRGGGSPGGGGGGANPPLGSSAGMCPLRAGRVRPRRKVSVRSASLRHVRTRGCLSGDKHPLVLVRLCISLPWLIWQMSQLAIAVQWQCAPDLANRRSVRGQLGGPGAPGVPRVRTIR